MAPDSPAVRPFNFLSTDRTWPRVANRPRAWVLTILGVYTRESGPRSISPAASVCKSRCALPGAGSALEKRSPTATRPHFPQSTRSREVVAVVVIGYAVLSAVPAQP